MLIIRALNVLAGLYSSPFMFCADRSPRKYMTSEDTNWVAYGRFLCDLPYAWKPFVKGPNRCHIGRAGTVGTVFATGMAVVSAFLLTGEGEELWRLTMLGLEIGRCALRKTARPALIANTVILEYAMVGAL